MPISPPTLPAGIFSGGANITDGWLRQYLQQIVTEVQSLGGAASVSVSEDYTALAGDKSIFVDASGADVTVTLPTAVGIAGKEYAISKRDASANVVVIDGAGAETINGAVTLVMSNQYDAAIFTSDGVEWGIF